MWGTFWLIFGSSKVCEIMKISKLFTIYTNNNLSASYCSLLEHNNFKMNHLSNDWKIKTQTKASISAAALNFPSALPVFLAIFILIWGKLSLTIGLKTEKMHFIIMLPSLHPGSRLARVTCKWRGTLFGRLF